MARSRNIKPGFYKNEDLAECSIWARYIFPGLWMMADRDGRLEDRPKRIKAEILPFDTQDVEPLLRELASKGFIVRYEIDGQRYIEIPRFAVHQNPHYSEKASGIKPPPTQENEVEQRDMFPDIGGSSPRSNASSRGGRNPLNPDSLNPDSLNPAGPQKNAVRADDLPDWVPTDAWMAFDAMRKAKRAPLTPRAVELIVAKLDEWRKQGDDPAEVLLQSVERGWTGVFQIKRDAGPPSRNARDAGRAAAAQAIFGTPQRERTVIDV